MKEALSYQRLLEITGKLAPEEQEYIFRFLSANERKLKLRLAELDETQQHYLEKSSAYKKTIAELHEALKRQREFCPKRDRAYKVLETLLLRAIRQTTVDDHTAKLLRLALEDVRKYLNPPEGVV